MLDEDFKNWIIGNMKIKQIAKLRQAYERETKPDLIAEALQRLDDAVMSVLGPDAARGFAVVDASFNEDEQALYDELDKNGLDNTI